jgi:hypothetical protein
VAAVALAVSAYSAFRLARAWPGRGRLRFDVNFSHVLMGIAMAGMAVPSLKVLPTVAWEGVFGAEALWFASAMARSSHCATHTVMAVCMLYMYLGAVPVASGHGGMPMRGALGGAQLGAGGASWLSAAFVLVLAVSAACEVGYVVRFARSGALSSAAGPALSTAGPALSTTNGTAGASPARAAPRLAPGLEAAPHVAMCLVMAFMLVVMG